MASNMVSGILAATVGHLLTKSYRDTELIELKEENTRLISENEKLNEIFETSDSTNKVLNSLMVDRNYQLQDCHRKIANVMRDFEQSYCLWRSTTYRSIFRNMDNMEQHLEKVNLSSGKISFKKGAN